MKISLLYFGRPREMLKLAGETVDLPAGINTLAELLAWLRLREGRWAEEMTEARVRCALNQEMSALHASLHEHDEVAFFSPISGG